MLFKNFIISCLLCCSFQEDEFFKKVPRNIAVTPETSHFNFDCEVVGEDEKGVATRQDVFIMSKSKIIKEYQAFYEANGTSVIYTKPAEQYVNDTYHDCIVFPFSRRARAVFSVLSKFTCNIPEKVREGEIMTVDMTIKFTHFSPTSKCNLGLASSTKLDYDNINNQEEKLQGKASFNHTASVVKSMNGQTLKCEIFYDESQDSLTEELDHLRNIQEKIDSNKHSIDTKQPKLLGASFQCERKVELEYGAQNITISIDGIIALCEYDSYPKSSNITWSIKQDENNTEKLSTTTNVLDIEKYQNKYVQISCDVRVDFYDGSFSIKSSEYSERTYVGKLL
ncbi:DgyrCDS412 [Dimorphilus gyrociliatus]|uniref:DgyrCDS412 n=1 Tax=Dimorphilus gyrociliatus TaxID=2664684 RepID=A0A7I8V613_9ANNE|nr:DgyrCDS412 [Dimorphilus gyrociliatus]